MMAFNDNNRNYDKLHSTAAYTCDYEHVWNDVRATVAEVRAARGSALSETGRITPRGDRPVSCGELSWPSMPEIYLSVF
jgi:hypothetical protein